MSDNNLKLKPTEYSVASAAPDIHSVYTWPSALNPPSDVSYIQTLQYHNQYLTQYHLP
jgi:hypothetical protein